MCTQQNDELGVLLLIGHVLVFYLLVCWTPVLLVELQSNAGMQA